MRNFSEWEILVKCWGQGRSHLSHERVTGEENPGNPRLVGGKQKKPHQIVGS